MKVVVSRHAREFVDAHGGVVYVRSHAHRCCSGPITLLDTTVSTPADADDFVPVAAGDVVVKFQGDQEAGPHELAIELRGVVRRHLVSYWDGCAYKL